MDRRALTLRVLAETFAVCRLPPDAPLPGWADGGALMALTRTAEELSVVCAEAMVPAGVGREGGWRALGVVGPLDFALTGILARLAGPLADAGIALFALSTYDTDYVLVKADMLDRAVAVLRQAGMTVGPDPGP